MMMRARLFTLRSPLAAACLVSVYFYANYVLVFMADQEDQSQDVSYRFTGVDDNITRGAHILGDYKSRFVMEIKEPQVIVHDRPIWDKTHDPSHPDSYHTASSNLSMPGMAYAQEDDILSQKCLLNDECARFRSLLQFWPPGKPRSVIYYLTQPSRIQSLQKSLKTVDAYFNDKYQYPVIIFHERDLVPMISSIRSFTRSVLFFQEVAFKVPDFITKPVRFNIPCFSHLGYRHMCRFHAKEVYNQPIMQGLDFSWRLDDDSFLTKPVNYDIFNHMKSHDLQYGYSLITSDANECVPGLWEAAHSFVKNNSIIAYSLAEWPKPQIYYNNFEISSMKLWTSSAYKRYIDFIDRLGGMYYFRWGDAPIKSIAVSIYVPKNQTHHYIDVGYNHRAYNNL